MTESPMLAYFFSTPPAGLHPVSLTIHNRIAGSQCMRLIDETTAWHLSALKEILDPHETNIRRLLDHTPLSRIHWINLQPGSVTFSTINKR